MDKEKTALHFIMEDKGIKTKWLADQIGVTSQTIRNYRNNQRTISKPVKKLISHVLDVSINDL